MSIDETIPAGLSRRDALKRAGLVAGGTAVVWAAPSVTTLGGAWGATGTEAPGGKTTTYNPTTDLQAYATTHSTGPVSSTAFGAFSAEMLSGSNFDNFENPNSQINGPTFKLGSGDLASGDYRVLGLANGSTLLLHPSSSDRVAVRFVVPATGSLAINATFTDGDSGGGDGVTVGIRLDAITLYSAGLNAPSTPTGTYSNTVAVTAGQVVLLYVDPNSNRDFDSTLLSATLTLTTP
jgi:hypothetical protein